MSAQSVAQRVLITGDVKAFRRHWGDLFPHLAGEGPKTDAEAAFALHYSRTTSTFVPDNLRLYSHDWLVERDYPSGLPDELKRKADRVEPVIASAVGITVKSSPDPERNAASLIIREAMENAVLDAAADGKLEDDKFVKARIEEARGKTHKLLFGRALGMRKLA